MKKIIVFLIFAYAIGLTHAGINKTINNDLKMSWPWDMVYFDFPSGTFKGPLSVKLTKEAVEKRGKDKKTTLTMEQAKNGWLRPAQIEKININGKKIDRVWFIATITGGKTTDKKGKIKRIPPPKKVEVSFLPKASPAGIKMKEDKDFYIIDNGVYEFKLRKYGKLAQATPLAKLKHWIGGMRVKGTDKWDGKAFFEGSGKVKSVKSEILNKGPVFIDIKLTYIFEGTSAGKTTAVPLMLGKKSHTYEPNKVPREPMPKHQYSYEIAVRFVMGDPWIEVAERNHLPRDPSVKSWGVHQFHLLWGKTRDNLPYELIDIPKDEYNPIDTVTWIRWFLYDQFGGNSTQQTIPAKPRPDQKGRPFALLRPRWNQGGGGSQDFILTSGGVRPPNLKERQKKISRAIDSIRKKRVKNFAELMSKAEEAREIMNKVKRGSVAEKEAATAKAAETLKIKFPDGKAYSANAPAFGIIAAYPSKWTNPYQATISAYVRDKQTGVRVPLIGGDGKKQNYYTNRCYAICVGPRKSFRNLNDFVRRHSDWTLAAQTAKYILDWKRDPSVAGANILLSKKRLKELQKQISSNADTKFVKIFNSAAAKYKDLKKQKSDAEETYNKDKKSEEGKKAKSLIKKLNKELGKSDMQLLGLLSGDKVKQQRLPDPSMYLNCRYQDDSTNPTNYGNRRLVNQAYPMSDLFSVGKPFGGPRQAAIGYIYSDLDAWPGWHNGWSPGNPNFHTDKYIASIFSAAAMQDHPHAKEWMAFGLNNFNSDLKKAFIAPDGVGMECPGYSGYSFRLQIEVARAIFNSGMGNPMAENPLIKKCAKWHRKLITPFDKRIKKRHEAPIGDTHRWDSGMMENFARLAPFFKKTDPEFAMELMGTDKFLKDNGANLKRNEGLRGQLEFDSSIKAMPVDKMDWSSEFFYGFGAIMRSGFNTDQETFLTFKAGPARGHYHNDELSWHYYADNTPISLDYNCSYHPRGDHACLHNTSTFGKAGTIRHNSRNQSVRAMEQAFGTANVGAFVSTPAADLVVAERVSSGLSMSPVDPHDAEFQRRYPYRKTDKLVHRRLLAMVKHPAKSKLSDYLVVREEFLNDKEDQQINIHLLARDVKQNGNSFLCTGQYDKDIEISVFKSEGLKLEKDYWYYYDEWMMHPDNDPYIYKEGEPQEAWAARMETLKKSKGLKSIPAPDWKPLFGNGKSNDPKDPKSTIRWRDFVHKTHGKAMMPPPGWTREWPYGECQLWLRFQTKPGSTFAYVIYPYKRSAERPKIVPIDNGNGVKITLGNEVDEIRLDSASGCSVNTGGKTTQLLKKGDLPEIGKIPATPPAINKK